MLSLSATENPGGPKAAETRSHLPELPYRKLPAQKLRAECPSTLADRALMAD